MSRLTDLALKDAKDCVSQCNINLYNIKNTVEATMRSLQDECIILKGLVSSLEGKTPEDKKANSKLLTQLNNAIEINRKMYAENYKSLDQIQSATTFSSRADSWIGAVSEDLKK